MTFYEVTPWRTVGGQSGKYELESPWDSACELIFTQVSGNIAGTIVTGFDSNDDLAAIIAGYATSTILTPGWRGMVLRVAANTPISFSNDPIPVENRRIYVQILTDAAGAIYVTAHFRRQAPEAGTYAHSDQNLAATRDMAPTAQQVAAMEAQWTDNLAADNSSGLRQSYRPENLSPIRRNTAWRHQKNKSLLDRFQGK